MEYKIPLFNLNYSAEEETEAVRTIRSRWISTGPRNAEFEERFSAMLGVRHAVAVTNCTVALHLALHILGIGEGDEVIVPSLTFVATANAVRYVNAVPVFCDIRSHEDLTLDPTAVGSLITTKTKAIMVMHYAGFPCDMRNIIAIAGKYGLAVIEDASHAPLSEYEGKRLGTLGDIGCFSFFSNKNISTGEGGMLVTNDRAHDEKARLLRSHGMTSLSYDRAKGHSTSYDVVALGFNYRMDDLRASLGIAQLNKLRPDLERRSEIRKRYIRGLAGIEGLTIPFCGHEGFVSNYIFPVILEQSTAERREFIRSELQRAGIQTSVHYPAVHKFGIYRGGRASLPLTEYVSDNEITLPMYAQLADDDIDYISQSLRAAIMRGSAS